ncbi:phenylalanine 4-monooxygenase [Halocynthiibacter sp. C4]|uniref:phenylalanine 4-monooxygenase n=1 Tax=Halocynthiibacter sp. C4 TaxID=2992758 RepID=UPI00237AEC9E|nr:phenylalanine 4-monooxygenase [Halocynthiibacter sp. C4]MDE0589335.1 phenylalanine 4-monooxygenase [Halocynthiibacter sp. C4]
MGKQSAYIAKLPDEAGRIYYTPEEDSVWADLYAAQESGVAAHMSQVYLNGLTKLDMPKTRVPQCCEISERLGKLTGWKVAPVPALIGFGRFFGMLAEKTFPAASFIRSRKDFDYIEEPDIFHEIFGHTPLLTDPRIAAVSEAIGKAGLRAEKKDYSWLIRLYWFSVEFGLLRENGALKGMGSGLASSPTELPHAVVSDAPERREFRILDVLRTPYRIDIHQPIYYVVDAIDDLVAMSERDLLADVREAQALGLFAPTYPEKTDA